jgi:hypothetical protein
VEDTSKLYQFSSVHRHFVLNKYAVVRGRCNTRHAKPHYLCTVVLLDISKDSDVVNSYELSSGAGPISISMQHGESLETGGGGGVKQAMRESGVEAQGEG